MIKLSDRLGMFWWHRGSAIRCFVLLIVVHNLVCTLKTATKANNQCSRGCHLTGSKLSSVLERNELQICDFHKTTI